MKIAPVVVLTAALIVAQAPFPSARSQPIPAAPQGPAHTHALVDVSCAKATRHYAIESQSLISEWYPKINAILYGVDHPLPFDTVYILFEPKLAGPAFTNGRFIQADCDNLRVMPDDYRGMLIHELTHVVQHYPSPPSNASWIVESIADYVRHKYFEADIQETLQLRVDGELFGYTNKQPYLKSVQTRGVSLVQQGYLKSYTIGSTFLFWLEMRKDAHIVAELNQALSQGQYTPELFSQHCGRPLDELWGDFVMESQEKRN